MSSDVSAAAPGPADPATAWWALHACADGVAVFDADWRIVYINPAGAAVLDRRVEELTGARMWEAFPEAVGTPFHRGLLQAAADPPGAEPVRWASYYGPVAGWFSDTAQRVGDHVVVVYTRADETRAAEVTRQRLTAQVQGALARSELLLAASAEFGAAVAVDDVVGTLQRLIHSGLSPSRVGLYLRDPDSPAEVRRERPGELPGPLRDRYERLALGPDQPLTAVVQRAEPLYFPDADAFAARFPQGAGDLREIGMQASAMIPVPDPADPATPLGALSLLWAQRRELDLPDRAVLTTLATYIGQAVARIRRTEREVRDAQVRYADTRAAVLTMQRSLLPDLPVLPQVAVVACYRPADAELAAGGDWYDCVPLPDGRLALLVGDVVGHGPAAAAAMAQLGSVAHHLLRTEPDPAVVLARLDAAAARSRATRAASLLLALLDPAGSLTWAGHGHPPPLLVDPGGRARPLPVLPAAPLGVGGSPPRWQTAAVAPGELVLLYTDGLVERPGRDLDAGLAALSGTIADLYAAGPPGDADDLQRLCVELTGRATGAGDDGTVLAARLHGEHRPLRLRVDSDPTQLRRVRRALAEWLAPLAVGDSDLMAVELVVAEATTNAVEHAYGGRPGPVELEVEVDRSGTAVVTVRDHGDWRPAPADPRQRGRGLQLIRALSDTVDVDRAATGTVLTARRLLHRSPALLTGGDVPRPPARELDAPYASSLTRGPVPVLRVSGAIDLTVEERLRTDLLGAARGGALPATVDLDGVTLLGSAGVRVLHELAPTLHLRLHAAPGTPARAVLDLTGLSGRVVEPVPTGPPAGT